jgi:hypothetical protein
MCFEDAVMPRRGSADSSDLIVAIQMFHGLCARVARQLGVHPTVVSRVANGKRKSPQIHRAIQHELDEIRDYLNRTPGEPNGK